jgi:hypothetical protein
MCAASISVQKEVQCNEATENDFKYEKQWKYVKEKACL